MDALRTATLVAATLTTGLSAGLFFAFAVAVMPGLGRSSDRAFVEVMQNINVAIVNGWFLVAFVGAPVVTGIAAMLHVPADSRDPLPWLIASFVLYAAALVITGRGNIPLNNALVNAGPPDQIGDPSDVRRRFEGRWNRLHVIRTLVIIAAFGCLIAALVAR